MKLISIFFSALVCVLTLSVCSFAESFSDFCDSDKPSVSRTLHNLSDVSDRLTNDHQFPLEDKTALSVTDFGDYGEITYAVEQVDEVTVSLYRYLSSFAVKGDDNVLRYNILPDSDTENFKLLPLLLNENDDAVYCLDNDTYYRLCYDESSGNYTFIPESSDPEVKLIPYGLDIQESFDGAVFQSIPTERIYTESHVFGSGDILFDEVFHANLSPSCRYLKIRIKQFSKIATCSSENLTGTMGINLSNPTMLHDVTVKGPEKPLNPGGNSSLPNHSENTFLGDKDKYNNTKKSSSSSSKSTSAKLPDNKFSNSTSSSVESSTSTTTKDSNNNSTSYTTNNYYFNLSPETASALEQLLKEGKFPTDINLPKEGQTENGTVSVIYDESLTIGGSDSSATPVKTPNSSSTNPKNLVNENKNILYLLIFGIAAIIVLQVIIILKPRKSTPPDNKSPDDDFEDEI